MSPTVSDIEEEKEVAGMIPDESLLYQLRAKPDTLVLKRIGKECPKETATVRWVSGISTVIPPKSVASVFPRLHGPFD